MDREEQYFQWFRLQLGVGGLVSAVAGVTGLVAPRLLDGWLGLTGVPAPPFNALGRLLGAVCVAVALGYVLAAVDPSRQRSLLAVLFCVPLVNTIAWLVLTLGGEMSTVRGWGLSIFSLAYTLVFVRLYPRHRAPSQQPAA